MLRGEVYFRRCDVSECIVDNTEGKKKFENNFNTEGKKKFEKGNAA